jgi:cytochrome P450
VDRPLIPFSEGPAECLGRNLVLLTTSSLLANLLSAGPLPQTSPAALDADRPLPRTLSPFRLAFDQATNPNG